MGNNLRENESSEHRNTFLQARNALLESVSDSSVISPEELYYYVGAYAEIPNLISELYALRAELAILHEYFLSKIS